MKKTQTEETNTAVLEPPQTEAETLAVTAQREVVEDERKRQIAAIEDAKKPLHRMLRIIDKTDRALIEADVKIFALYAEAPDGIRAAIKECNAKIDELEKPAKIAALKKQLEELQG